jgi:hypothetical protein
MGAGGMDPDWQPLQVDWYIYVLIDVT